MSPLRSVGVPRHANDEHRAEGYSGAEALGQSQHKAHRRCVEAHDVANQPTDYAADGSAQAAGT